MFHFLGYETIENESSRADSNHKEVDIGLAIEEPIQDTQSDVKKTCKVGVPSMEKCKQQHSADTGMQPKMENHQSVEHKPTISHLADANTIQDIIPGKLSMISYCI